MESTQQTSEPVTLTVQDIALVAEIIKVVSERGAFKAEEMAMVGGLYNRVTAFIQQQQELANAARQDTEGDSSVSGDHVEGGA